MLGKVYGGCKALIEIVDLGIKKGTEHDRHS